jgi:tight adherence protein C
MSGLDASVEILFKTGLYFLAFVFGFAATRLFVYAQLKSRHRKAVINDDGLSSACKLDVYAKTKVDLEVLKYAADMSTKIALGKLKARKKVFDTKGTHVKELLVRAGVSELISAEGLYETRWRLGILLAIVGCILGSLFSIELALVGLLAGLIAGFRMPVKALNNSAEFRKAKMETGLPEMLDVVALGMRSGLSFDSSLQLYIAHFETHLSRELDLVYRKWTSGLARRDDALREFAATYKSFQLNRTVETIVRSIRFGTQMADNLECSATEARDAYKASREEAIAKAPVKMMIPTGTLILPAMLIMVMGPVMLNLIQGGV